MRPTPATFLASASFLFACSSTPPAAAPSIPTADRLSRATTRGVLEVVVPTAEDVGVRYRGNVPTEEHSEEYVHVGAAFAVSTTRFVTAEQVLPAARGTLHDRVFLRDADGKVYAVTRITKYSQLRDAVELELDGVPPDLAPLSLRPEPPAPTEAVYTVEPKRTGSVVRPGGSAGTTTDPASGFPLVRFAVSGPPTLDTGAPLVDGTGRVLAVVLGRSDAVGRLALPIAEVQKLSDTEGEIFIKGINVSEDRARASVDWRAAPKLPATLTGLRTEVATSFAEFITKAWGDVDAKHAGQVFPTDPNLAQYLPGQEHGWGLGAFVVDTDGGWSVQKTVYTDLHLPWVSGLSWRAADRASGEILLYRPHDMPLAGFFATPRLLAEALVQADGWKRTIAGHDVLIESLGDPASSERWVDGYGRPWFSFEWPLRREEAVLSFDCLTNANGWACRWAKRPPLLQGTRVLRQRHDALRTTLAYRGTVRDWNELLTLPAPLRPRILEGVTLHGTKPLELQAGPFSIRFNLLVASEKSSPYDLTAESAVSIWPMEVPASHSQTIADVRLEPPHDTPLVLGVETFPSPAMGTMVGPTTLPYLERMKKVRAAAFPFDGTPFIEGDGRWIRHVEKPAPTWGYYASYCHGESVEPKAGLEGSCAAFRKGLVISPAPSSPAASR